MTNYRLNAARLIVASYGDQFDPTTGALPHVYADKFDPLQKIQGSLTNSVLNWQWTAPVDPTTPAEELAAISEAMRQARTSIGRSITTVMIPPPTIGNYTLEDVNQSYRPVQDATGAVIGHDTVTWLYKNAAPVSTTTTAPGPILGLLACVFISIRRMP